MASRIGDGDLTAHAPVEGPPETRTLARLDRAEADISVTEPVDVGTVVVGRLDAWRAAGAEIGVVFLGDPPCGGSGVQVMVTPGHLEQVLDKVLSNALAVSPQNATITVRVRAVAYTVMLEVLDEGPGMDDAEKARAFDRFWRGRG